MRQLLLLLPLFYHVVVYAETEQIMWISSDPQGHTYKNLSTIGIKTVTFRLLQEELSDYKFEVMVANNARAMQLLDSMPNYCMGNKVLSNERVERFYHTDLPQTLFPGLRLYVVKDSPLYRTLKSLNSKQQSLSITQVLGSVGEKGFGLVGGRSYGQELDQHFADPRWKQKLWIRTAADMSAGMLNMLSKKRVAALMESPTGVHHYLSQLGNTTELHSYAIKESPEMALGYIFCSKSAQGKQVISAFNQALKKLTPTSPYLQAHLDRLPQQDKDAYLHLYNQVYGTNFRGALVGKQE